MKIGIDIRALQWDHRYRGIGIYITNLILALSKIDHKNTYTFYGWSTSNPLHELKLDEDFKYEFIGLKPISKSIVAQKLANTIKRDIRITPKNIDVFFQPEASFGLATGNVASVGVVYDLIELIYKEHHYPASWAKLIKLAGPKHALGNKIRWRLYKWHLSQLQQTSKLIAISNSTKNSFIRQFPSYPKSKVSVIPLASDLNKNMSGIRKEPATILYIGASDYRKNLASLVGAFNKLKTQRPNAKLILAGKAFGQAAKNLPEHQELWNRINSSPHQADIEIHDFLDRAELANLYSKSTVFVFPSLYEGFGMPILEAMACGTPVISYNTSSIPEVAGKAALLIEPGSDLSKPILRLLNDKKLQQKLSKLGLEQAKKFTWRKTAKQTLKVLEMAAQK